MSIRRAFTALPPWLLDLAALLAGACQVLAFAPVAWRPMWLVGNAALLLLWLVGSPQRCALRGLLGGIGLFGCGISWVYNSLHDFGAAPAPVAALGTSGLVLLMALFPALLGWLIGLLRCRDIGFTPLAMVAFPALLTLLEWLRERFLGGFPWLAPANTLLDTPLESWAPVAGPAGLNLVAGALAAALAMVMTPGARQRLLGAALIAILVGGGVLLDLPRWTSVGGAPFQIAVIQGNVAQDLKWRPEWRQRTLDTYQEMTHRAGPARLVLWPETAAPAYLDLLQGYTAPLAGLVAERGGALLMGAPTRDESGRSFNSLVVVGSKYGQYDKQHLVPFGEFIPLRRLVTLLGGLVQIPMSDFTPGGTDQPLLQAAGVELGASICFEVAFADEVRRALPEAELLVNVSNDAWFGNSLAPHQHLEMARLRALETGRFLVRATNTGISAIIGPDGNLRQRSAQFQAQILRGAVTPRTGSTPFVRWGQWPALLLGVALLLVLLISLRRSPN